MFVNTYEIYLNAIKSNDSNYTNLLILNESHVLEKQVLLVSGGNLLEKKIR